MRDTLLPLHWLKGLIVIILKNRELEKCDNWRGITLLAVPKELFCVMIFARI